MTDEDPEVFRDRMLQASTMRDSSRGLTLEAIGSFAPSRVVEEWPCRAPRCTNVVGIPREAIEALDVFNAQLRATGQAEIPRGSLACCDEHRAQLKAHFAERADVRAARLRSTIQRLKASTNPRNEHELLLELKRDHHPDIDGLLAALEETNKPSKRSGRGTL